MDSPRCRITGVALHRGELRFEGPMPSLSVTYDLLEDSKELGVLFHGTSVSESWSKDVEDALAVLQQKIKTDLMVRHFDVDEGTPGKKKGKKVDTLFADSDRKPKPRSI